MSRVLPILFNADMVRAILDGRKTVTRRVVKPRSKKACGFYVTFRKSDNAFMGVYDYDENERQFDSSQTPPYQPGDILYVRETYCPNYFDFVTQYGSRHGYKADYDKAVLSSDITEPKWTPSIHMPKEAARIWLKVTDVRVKQLNDISGQEILKEGINSHVHPDADYFDGNQKEMFAELWDSTIKKSDLALYGWDANPWVWVIEFERCEKPDIGGNYVAV